jgi:hypothetical protein
VLRQVRPGGGQAGKRIAARCTGQLGGNWIRRSS